MNTLAVEHNWIYMDISVNFKLFGVDSIIQKHPRGKFLVINHNEPCVAGRYFVGYGSKSSAERNNIFSKW